MVGLPLTALNRLLDRPLTAPIPSPSRRSTSSLAVIDPSTLVHTPQEHQLAVIDCLEDPDDTLKLKTLELLYKMTKANNAEVIVERMMTYLRRYVCM